MSFLLVILLSIGQDLLLDTMHIVDYYGSVTDTEVIEVIDELNEYWYDLEDIKTNNFTIHHQNIH